MYPPAWIGPRRSIDAFELHGVRVPGGVLVNYCSWASHHLPEVFPEPFRFRGLGFLVPLGRQSAAAELRGMRFSGLPAWLLWRGVYLWKLPGPQKRLRVLLDWTIELLFPRDIALTTSERHHQAVK